MSKQRDIIVTQLINDFGVTLGVDAKPLVRCRDCSNWDTSWTPERGGHYCTVMDAFTADWFYCANGEDSDAKTTQAD